MNHTFTFYCLWALSVVKLCRPLAACHVVKSRSTCTFTHICCFYFGSTIHIYPSISISTTTQKYSTPNPGENNQKTFLFFPWNKCSSYVVTTTCYNISRDECSKKKRKEKKEIRGNKKGQVPGTSKEKKKVWREVKMDKCPTVELGVQDTHLREKEKKKKSISFSSQSFKKQGRYVSPQKSKSRIRLSPLLSPSSPYTIHSPHMHILIRLVDLFLWIHGLTIQYMSCKYVYSISHLWAPDIKALLE